MTQKDERVYTILELDEHYIESHVIYRQWDKAKKHFMKYLSDSGLGIINKRRALKAEFYQEGTKQIQIIKSEIKE
jgi:hypothetical protein